MTSLVLFKPDDNVPAHIAAGPVVKLNDNAFAGMRASFAFISIEGKNWTVRYRQTDTLLRGSPGYDASGRPLPVQPLRELPVIVVGVSPIITKQWYKSGHVPGSKGTMPDCFSIDGVRPDADSPMPQAATCADCSRNVFGSRLNSDGTPGKGKACGDNRKIAVVPAGDPENAVYGGPMMLRLPATSMPNFATYCGQIGAHGFDVTQVITVMSFDEEAQYSEIQFVASDLIRDPATYATVIKWAQSDMVRRMLTEAPETTVQRAGNAAPATPRVLTFLDHADEALRQASTDPRAWTLELMRQIDQAPSKEDLVGLQNFDGVKLAYKKAPPAVIDDIDAAFARAARRLGAETGATAPEPAATASTAPQAADAGDAHGAEHDAPGEPAKGAVGAFIVWLVDHAGDPVVSAKHGSGLFTDPVSYARALVDYLDHDCFPADIEITEGNNADDAALAAAASQQAKAILEERTKRILAAQMHSTKPVIPPAKPIEAPKSMTKEHIAVYVDAVQAALAQCHIEAQVDQFVELNFNVYDGLPGKHRVAVKQLVSDRRHALKTAAKP